MSGVNWIDDAIEKKYIKYYEFKNFLNLEKIGSGGFGMVYCANWKNPRTILALKSLNDTTAEKIVYELKIQREVHFHNNIIKFHGVTINNQNSSSKKCYMLVMEYADSGTLRNYLEKNNSLTWNDKFKMAYQLASGVLCLHDENIIHRDLHSCNVLVHQNTIKLADFGLSKMLNDPSASQQGGVVPYIDPKKFVTESYSLNQRSDVYSIGVLLWEISSCRPPFEDMSNQLVLPIRISQGLRETPIPNTPKDYENLYTDCWKHEPDDRPIIKNVVARLEAIMPKYERSPWTPSINSLSYNNLFRVFNNNIYDTIKVEPLKSPSKAPQTNFYKQKSEKDIVDGIAAFDDSVYDQNKKQKILDYIKDHNKTSGEIFDWLSNNQNETNSLLVLGDFYYLGIATLADKKKAFKYYEEAGNKGNSLAQYTLGIISEKEMDDTGAAIYWFNQSAKQGNQKAINEFYRLQTSNDRTLRLNRYSILGNQI